MEFKEYIHLERLGTTEVEGILDGECWVFPKIDGTNASVWFDGSKIRCGSRKRDLTPKGLYDVASDNAGFRDWVLSKNQEKLRAMIEYFPNNRFYGEWLVPHSLKTYRDDAWRDFYVFDVQHNETGQFVEYEEYKTWLEDFGINYIPPIAKIKNPNEDDIYRLLDRSGEFLVKDGMGKGEGVVVKNYSFVNQYGRTTWAKLVTNEFKEKHSKEMGPPEIHSGLMVEEKIVQDFLTEEFIKKEKAKIETTHGGWSSSNIGELLGRVWYEFIREETTNFLKVNKNPKINFKLLNTLVIKKTKEVINI